MFTALFKIYISSRPARAWPFKTFKLGLGANLLTVYVSSFAKNELLPYMCPFDHYGVEVFH